MKLTKKEQEKRLNRITNIKLLPAYFVKGVSGQKIWKFPLAKTYSYDSSNEPIHLTANYRGRCDDTLHLMK